MQNEFREFMLSLGVHDVFFTPEEVAKSTLKEQGGVGCRAKGISEPALEALLGEVRPPVRSGLPPVPERKEASLPRRKREEPDADEVIIEGVRFTPMVPGINDDGRCFWDTLARLGVAKHHLQVAAEDVDLKYGDWVSNDRLSDFMQALNRYLQPAKTLKLRVHHVDQLQDGPMKPGDSVEYGEGDVVLTIALFYTKGDDDEGQGHFVPPNPRTK